MFLKVSRNPPLLYSSQYTSSRGMLAASLTTLAPLPSKHKRKRNGKQANEIKKGPQKGRPFQKAEPPRFRRHWSKPMVLRGDDIATVPISASPVHDQERGRTVTTMAGDTTASAEDAEARRLVEEAARVGELARELQDSAANLISRTWNEEQVLRQRALALDADLRRLQSSLDAAARHGRDLDLKDAEKLDEELYRARCLISDGDVGSLLPSKSRGRFLRMFLGPINVRATRKDVRLKVKEEYNKYRDRTAFMFLLFPSTLLLLRTWVWKGCFPAWPVQLYQAWLLFLYTSLALRENILRANGSDIRPWWVYHHYCAMLMAIISLTWEIKGQPDCANKQKGVQLFLEWAVMQGIAMLLQNRYQRQRLYTRIALGKARRMDVVWGETAGVEGQLWLLCPILFILQGFEAYVGVKLLLNALQGLVPEWQVVVCGILLVLMAVGNFANTVQTLMAKSRFKAKMKRSKSKQELDGWTSHKNLRSDRSI